MISPTTTPLIPSKNTSKATNMLHCPCHPTTCYGVATSTTIIHSGKVTPINTSTTQRRWSNPSLTWSLNTTCILPYPQILPTYETVTSNWTHPDNIWHNDNIIDPILICNVNPSIQPPHADHLPIYIELDLPIHKANAFPTCDMCDADFKVINDDLKKLLNKWCPAKEILSKEELNNTVDKLVEAIHEVLEHNVPISKLCLYMKRWWMEELTDLKQVKNKLSKVAFCFRGTLDHPAHTEHKAATWKFSHCVEDSKKKHWSKWLENANTNDIYTSNKYINGELMDFSNTCIPTLKMTDTTTGTEMLAIDNSAKAQTLAKIFFPPPPNDPTIPDTAYPKPLRARYTFTHDNIKDAIKKLSPYKAPEIDGIQNVIIQECSDTIIDHLYYIYCAVFLLNTYPDRWLTTLTIVLYKLGKAVYNVAKSYRPISLLKTLGKLLSTLVAADLAYLMEKYQLLPPMQFRGRAGRCMTDAMHLVTQKIKDTWRRKKWPQFSS